VAIIFVVVGVSSSVLATRMRIDGRIRGIVSMRA
jgi:hypothetical protein